LRVSAFAAAVALAERAVAAREVQQAVPAGWRNVTSQPQRSLFTVLSGGKGEDVVAEWYGGRDGYRSADGTLTAELSGAAGAMAVVRADKSAVRVRVRVHVAGAAVDVESSLGHVALTRRPWFVDPAARVPSGSLLAPMPGAVVRIDVVPGATVAAGQPVLVLEAMKMQHTVTAPYDGVVTEIPVDVGSHVAAAAVLAVVQSAATEESPR
jgi:propionyl-CoA carboxylase alpha chain